MAMLSNSSADESSSQMPTKTLSVRGRTYGYLSNAAAGERIVIKGVVTEDVLGWQDSHPGRQQSGRNQPDRSRQRRAAIAGKLVDFRRKPGIPDPGPNARPGFWLPGDRGKVTSFESELSQRQAVVRHGGYFFLADKTPLVLLLKGKASLKELKILESLE